MSQLNREQVIKLAKLSRLSLNDEEISKYQEELSAILGYIERLNQVDITGLSPTYQVSGLINQMRKDVIIKDQPVAPDELLNLAPNKQGRYIKVKRMI